MKNEIPKNALEFIKQCIREGKLYWTYHVNMRLERRTITREMIISSLDNMEIIEEYPDDKYLPSYLVLSKYKRILFHVLIAADVIEENIRIITAYIPDKGKWEEDFKRRRKKK